MVLVGTSGWSHPDWVGAFYPVALRERPESWLAHYASRFRTVEIASTFDAFPSEELVEEWALSGVALQERAHFEFNLKLPRVVTHDALVTGDAERAREMTGRFDREVLDRLAGEGLLGAVVLQLPSEYAPSAARVAAIGEVVGALAERHVAIEFRDARWFHRGCVIADAEPLFASPFIALVEHDGPAAPAAVPPLVARHAYLRLHGRRRDLWRAPRVAADDRARYDYLYAEDELRPFAERAAMLEAAGARVRVVFNNTPSAKAVANAIDLQRMLGHAPPDAPRPRLTEQQRLPL